MVSTVWFRSGLLIAAAAGLAGSSAAQSLDLTQTRVWDRSHPLIEGAYEPNGEFGFAIAVGDLDQDGLQDVVVGSPAGSIAGYSEFAGTINLLMFDANGELTSGEVWHHALTTLPGGPGADDRFGASVAIGDFDCDNQADVAVGAPGRTVGGAANAGALYVKLARGAVHFWTQDDPGMNEDAEEGDGFASQLAAYDIDGDGCSDLAIGVPLEDADSDTPDTGTVHVLYGSIGFGLDPGNSQTLVTEIEQPMQAFGHSLALYSNPPFTQLVIGSPFRNSGLGEVGDYRFSGRAIVNLATSMGVDVGLLPLHGWSVAAREDQFWIGVPGATMPFRGFVLGTPDLFTGADFGFTGQDFTPGDFDGDAEPDVMANSQRSGDGHSVVHVRFGAQADLEMFDSVPGRPSSVDFGRTLETGDLDRDGVDDLLLWDKDALLQIPGTNRLLIDGFESGDTSAWSVTVP